MPIGAYTPKERVVLHMATRQKRRVFLGYFPLLSSNSSDDPSDVGRDGHRDGALGELGGRRAQKRTGGRTDGGQGEEQNLGFRREGR